MPTVTYSNYQLLRATCNLKKKLIKLKNDVSRHYQYHADTTTADAIQ